MNTRGFTLIELLVVIAVVAITATLAVPMYGSLVESSRLTTTTNNFIEAIALARSEAIKRGAVIEVGKAGDSWGNGWNVRTIDIVSECPVEIPDCEDEEKIDVDKGVALSTYEGATGSVSIGFSSDSETLTFNPSGMRVNGSQFNIIICAPSSKGRQITITAAGSTSVTKLESGCSV